MFGKFFFVKFADLRTKYNLSSSQGTKQIISRYSGTFFLGWKNTVMLFGSAKSKFQSIHQVARSSVHSSELTYTCQPELLTATGKSFH